jgi:hypothetical protein
MTANAAGEGMKNNLAMRQQIIGPMRRIRPSRRVNGIVGDITVYNSKLYGDPVNEINVCDYAYCTSWNSRRKKMKTKKIVLSGILISLLSVSYIFGQDTDITRQRAINAFDSGYRLNYCTNLDRTNDEILGVINNGTNWAKYTEFKKIDSEKLREWAKNYQFGYYYLSYKIPDWTGSVNHYYLIYLYKDSPADTLPNMKITRVPDYVIMNQPSNITIDGYTGFLIGYVTYGISNFDHPGSKTGYSTLTSIRKYGTNEKPYNSVAASSYMSSDELISSSKNIWDSAWIGVPIDGVFPLGSIQMSTDKPNYTKLIGKITIVDDRTIMFTKEVYYILDQPK